MLKHWRPISLLSSDYKILTKALAIQIKDVLPEIIHENQVGYIGDAIRIIEDILHITNEEHIPRIMVAVDFEKVFDSIEWRFIEKALSLFNFGPVFRKWINIIYNDRYSCIINNGFTSGYFNLTRGVRQGDPLSPYLLIVAVEVLALALRQENSIKGVKINKTEIKLLQYADDTTCFISDIKSAKLFLKMLKDFENISGLKVNIEKN